MRLWTLLILAGAVLLMAGATRHPQAVAADVADVAVTIKDFSFTGASVRVPLGTTVTWTNQDGADHTSTSDTGLWDSPTLGQGESFSFTFSTPGEFPYHCALHSSMRGKVTVLAESTSPELTSPQDGVRLEGFGPALAWNSPPGATHVHLQVIPFNNDGPGVDLVLGGAPTAFTIPAPPGWYGLLPDMTYTWRVRTSPATAPAGPDDPSWSGWAERRFRTPLVSSATITAVSQPTRGAGGSTTPTLQWVDQRNDVFYYEVQVSKDPGFGPTAFLYWELRHGGATNPPNSYTVPPGFPLEPSTTYFWRVRPRVQGDGAPVAWSSNFQVASGPGSAPTPTATPGGTPAATPPAGATR